MNIEKLFKIQKMLNAIEAEQGKLNSMISLLQGFMAGCISVANKEDYNFNETGVSYGTENERRRIAP